MKRRIIILMLLTVLTTLYFYLCSTFSYDSVWNYGFAYNISKGLIPYKDYNMIITPLFPYLLSILIKIFGHKLILYYILIALLIVLTSYISYKKIGFRSIFIFLILLSVHELGYNVLAIFLFMLLLYILDNKKTNNDIMIAVIISLMILTKQTLGILIIPSIIYSKDKMKTIMVYIISFLVLLVYLLINNNLYEFINYCFLGMFDFANNNSTSFSFITLVEIIICICLVVGLLKSKFKNKELFYILLFQIIVLPIVDGVHFVIVFVPVLYYIFYKYNYKIFNYLCYCTIISFTVAYNYWQFNSNLETIYNNKNSFMHGKKVQSYLGEYFEYVNKYRNKYKKSRIYFLDSRAYLIKLEFNMKIDKYDLINNGNMGYKGSKKYIEEIDKYCNKHDCVFFICNDKEIDQANREILEHFSKKYNKEISSNLDNIYKN